MKPRSPSKTEKVSLKKRWKKFKESNPGNFFYSNVTVTDKSGAVIGVIRKPRSFLWLWASLIALLFGLCFIIVPLKAVKWDQIGVIFSQLFVPSKWSLKTDDGWWNFLWTKACAEIWTTLEMVYIATFVGVLISVPVYILAAQNIDTNPVIRGIVKFVMNIVRTIPTYVLAIIATIFFGFNETSGVFAMIFFTQGVMFKMMFEFVETCDMNPYELAISSGSRKLQAYSVAMSPQVMPMFLSNTIYIFEINVRASVILGFVGAGGIGQMLADALESTSYDKVGAILIPLFVIVVALQLLSNYLRRRLV
jgi:phosphonate transport system permease protein